MQVCCIFRWWYSSKEFVICINGVIRVHVKDVGREVWPERFVVECHPCCVYMGSCFFLYLGHEGDEWVNGNEFSVDVDGHYGICGGC